VAEACPQCGTDFLVRAGKKNEPVLKCVSGTCSYERPIEGDEDFDEPAETEASESTPNKRTGAGGGA
jgi:hypothetical protein